MFGEPISLISCGPILESFYSADGVLAILSLLRFVMLC